MLTFHFLQREVCAGPAFRVGPALLLLLALGFSLGGCYSYRPLIGVDPAPTDEVRVRLADAAATQLSQRVGVPLRSVEGTVLRVPADTLFLDVGWGSLYTGTVFEGRRDTLSFGRSQILELDRREFSRGRTALVAGALVGAGVWIIRAISGSGGTSGGPGDGGNPTF
ncbi:MAG: hypothetical protein WEA09_04755 [Gemmatimonadota bacterium]